MKMKLINKMTVATLATAQVMNKQWPGMKFLQKLF